MPVFFEHLVEALRSLAQTLREHPRLRWLLLGGIILFAVLLLMPLLASLLT